MLNLSCVLTLHYYNDHPDIRDISDVMNEVDSLAGQWEKFAQQLGVKPGNIGIFKANRMGDVMMALNDAVSDWLKRNHDVRKFGKPSWRTLANAVRTIDGHLAHSIAMRHRKGMHKVAGHPCLMTFEN